MVIKITAIETPKMVRHTLEDIQNWDQWNVIQLGAEKEYDVTKDQFIKVLPEYQKFLALLTVNQGLGMFSEEVDKLWHTHILNTPLYQAFCNQFMGRYVHHVPNLEASNKCKSNECTAPDPCASRCLSICKTPPPSCKEKETSLAISSSADYFREVYVVAFGPPPHIWNLPLTDGIAL